MAMENKPFEDVFPFEDGDFPASYVSLPEILPRYDTCVLTISNYLMAFSDLGFGGARG